MKPHILVVDDSLTVRMDLRGSLTAAGFDVTVCDSKRTADSMLRQRQFSAAILDVMLPDGDGVTILREIRANESIATMPVVLLSSEADVRDRIRGLTMGADEYVGKPYDIAYLIRCVRTLCGRERPSIVPPAPAIVAGRRILAVDDSPTFLAHLARILREDGHDVVLARSGREALDMLVAQTIDCVVLDLQMPDIDGIETLRRIRQIPGRESTPTMILTASEDPEDQRHATAAGVDDFLRKTVAFDLVRAKIRNLLRRKHADRAVAEQQNAPHGPSARTNLRTEIQNERRMNSKPPSRPFPAPTIPTAPARNNHDNMISFSPLFIEVAAAMGLHADLARDALVRTLRRLNIDPKAMNCADLSRALPTIHDTLKMFFPADEAGRRARTLLALASRTERSTSV